MLNHVQLRCLGNAVLQGSVWVTILFDLITLFMEFRQRTAVYLFSIIFKNKFRVCAKMDTQSIVANSLDGTTAPGTREGGAQFPSLSGIQFAFIPSSRCDGDENCHRANNAQISAHTRWCALSPTLHWGGQSLEHNREAQGDCNWSKYFHPQKMEETSLESGGSRKRTGF